MKNDKLDALLDQAVSLTSVQNGLLSNLKELEEEYWAGTRYGETTGNNDLTGAHGHITGAHENEVRTLLKESPDEDLFEIANMSQQEGEARRALAILQQAALKVEHEYEHQLETLRKWQMIRDIAPEELERRHRQQMVSNGGGEALDQFTSRWLFGPWPPKPFVLGDKGAKTREWLLARVKSGKQVAVENMQFDFNPIFDAWLAPVLVQHGFMAESQLGWRPSAPRMAKPPLANLYYKLGFKPTKSVQGAYSIKHGWSSSYPWHLTHSRTFKAIELLPVE